MNKIDESCQDSSSHKTLLGQPLRAIGCSIKDLLNLATGLVLVLSTSECQARHCGRMVKAFHFIQSMNLKFRQECGFKSHQCHLFAPPRLIKELTFLRTGRYSSAGDRVRQLSTVAEWLRRFTSFKQRKYLKFRQECGFKSHQCSFLRFYPLTAYLAEHLVLLLDGLSLKVLPYGSVYNIR